MARVTARRLPPSIECQVPPVAVLSLPEAAQPLAVPMARPPWVGRKPVFGMRRREFIALLGSGAVAWPPGAMAQQPSKIARIGYLGPQPDNPMIVASYSVIASELRRL